MHPNGPQQQWTQQQWTQQPQQQWTQPQQPAQPFQQAMPHQPMAVDFDRPVELRCVMQPTAEMRRMTGLFVFIFLFAGLVAAVIFGLFMPTSPLVYYPLGAIVGAAVAAMVRSRVKARLTRTYGELQRLQLSPFGMVRTDGTIATEMAWSEMSRIEVMNSALRSRRANLALTGPVGVVGNATMNAAQTRVTAGIVGRARITPLPGAVRTQLKVHDRNTGGASNLRGGQQRIAEEGLIFPSEFEEDWMTGTVGAWLRHYRPDLQFPV